MRVKVVEFAFVYPGQGSQKVGMGRELFEKFQKVRSLFETSERVSGRLITKLCFEGPQEDLTLTINAQPAIFTVSVACHQLLAEHGLRPALVAGHSMGEISALVAAGALDFEDGLRLVNARSGLMHETRRGGMAAIIGASRAKVEELCELASERGVVVPANFNSPDQIVVSGEVEAVDYLIQLAPQYGAQRAVRLNVSGAFHSPLMKEAQEKFQRAVQETPFSKAAIPIIANVTAQPVTHPQTIRNLLVKQLTAPVRWEESVRFLLSQGVKTFVEVGPHRVLSGLIKRIERHATTLNVEDPESLERTVASLR